VVPRTSLLSQGWGDASEASSGSLDVLVGRIRRKIGPDWIRIIRNEGYALGV
jgi:DNA-binding response OmpR family regulator